MDSSLECYTGPHLLWVILAGMPMLLLYVIGIPGFCFLQLWRGGCQATIERWVAGGADRLTAADRQMMRLYSFFFKGYRVYGWEMIVIARKVPSSSFNSPSSLSICALSCFVVTPSRRTLLPTSQVSVLAIAAFFSKEELRTQIALVPTHSLRPFSSPFLCSTEPCQPRTRGLRSRITTTLRA